MSQFLQSTNILILILGLAYLVSSEECPNIKTVSNFQPAKYLGKWYEIQKYPQMFEMNSKCVTATYSLNPNGTVDVYNQAIIPPNTKIEIRGYATMDPSNPANLTVVFPGVPIKGKYWVIDTDYTTYSLVYSCSLDMNRKRMENAWVLSRSPQLTAEVVTDLTQELVAVKSSTNLFEKTDQTGCPK